MVILLFLCSSWLVNKQQSTPSYLAKNHYLEIVEISEYPRFCERGEEKIIKLGQKFNAELKRGKLSYEDIGITENLWKTAVQKAWANTYAYYVDKASHASTQAEENRAEYYKKALVCYLRAQQWVRGENKNFTEDVIPSLVDDVPGGEAEIDPKVAEVVVRIVGDKANLEKAQKENTFRSENFSVSGYIGHFEVKLFSGPEDQTSEFLLPVLRFYWAVKRPDSNYTFFLEDTRLTGVVDPPSKDEVWVKKAGDVNVQELYQSALNVMRKS